MIHGWKEISYWQREKKTPESRREGRAVAALCRDGEKKEPEDTWKGMR